MRIAINGFGRIGESVLRAALTKKIDVVAINDVHGIKNTEYIIKYDSVYGKFKGRVKTKDGHIYVNGKKILIIGERNPEKLPWKRLKIDLVIESTGAFRTKKDAMKHIYSGAKKVIVTAPMKDKSDVTIVPGVNDKDLKKTHKIISVASCTTNCSAVVAKIIDETFGIRFALLSTVHGYTSSQSLVDSSNEKDPRRGRAAAVNLVPTTTGAAKSVAEVLPRLKGKLDGSAIRAPLPDGSIIDFVIEVKKPASIKKVNDVLKKASKGKMKRIIEYSTDDLVSSDVLGNPHSAIIDSKMTKVEGNLVKILAWYDNEQGYSCRVADLVKLISKK
ncbi:MAG: type I glyceraldehyde-3-phosphate dehydrogenase [Candidatus Pacearchaeota archaeon]